MKIVSALFWLQAWFVLYRGYLEAEAPFDMEFLQVLNLRVCVVKWQQPMIIGQSKAGYDQTTMSRSPGLGVLSCSIHSDSLVVDGLYGV